MRGRLALLQQVCASLQVHVEVPSAAAAERAQAAVAKPLKVLLAGVHSPVGIRWVLRARSLQCDKCGYVDGARSVL